MDEKKLNESIERLETLSKQLQEDIELYKTLLKVQARFFQEMIKDFDYIVHEKETR